jgi:glutamate dehydrogenase
MLLSKQIRLLAAFDHRHIFLDPDPDPAKSWVERKRMFDLPRSSWDDYNRKLISRGGGVFSRALKSIPLTAQVRTMLGVTAEALAPTELINAILKAQAELLYLGGIGTYVKARHEANADVGDKANDSLRVNGSDLRVKVVGEGANLGLTQAGRIEFARAGGRIDTDAIDNSAGVDTSDHEVNIKILTGMLERTGHLTRKRRDTLLKSMTADVGRHVLAHNYDQTLALSLMEMDAAGELEPLARFMSDLEHKGRLDRAVEGLPDAAGIAELAAAGKGLTRPELAVLLAYGKLELKREIIASDAPDDHYFESLLEGYFPKALRKYDETMRRHRLRRDIIATVVANDAINRCGPSFPSRLIAAAGCDAVAFTSGYEAAKSVLDIPALWNAVAALDGKVPAAGQMALFRRLSAALRGAAFWLARGAARERLDVNGLIKRYGPGFKTLTRLMPEIMSPIEQAQVTTRLTHLVEAGAPENLARAAAILQPLTTAGDLVDIAEASTWPLAPVARLYHAIGAAFGFDRVRQAAGAYAVGDTFERMALRRLIEDLLAQQTELTHAVMAFTGGPQCGEDAEAAHDAAISWAALRRDKVDVALHTIAEIEASGGVWTFAKLTIANAALRELAEAAKKKR